MENVVMSNAREILKNLTIVLAPSENFSSSTMLCEVV